MSMDVDTDLLLAELTLSGPASTAQLVEAISKPPALSRTIDGATTLEVEVRDTRRGLLRSGMFDSRSWAVVDGLHFELVQVKKAGDAITLTFEDAIVAALRRRTDPRSFAAGTATRQQIAAQLAAEAMVVLEADPAARPVVAAALDRSADGRQSSSWELLGSLAEGADWRRFSDGARVLFGSDDWLMSRLPPLALLEHTGPVGTVDFDLDVGQPASRATVDVDTTRWSVPPAQPVDLVDLGPASGRWLVESFTRELTRTAGSVNLVRGRPSLQEPPPDETTADSGEAGEADFLPDGPGSVDTSAPGDSSAPVEVMLRYALAQKGKRYVWGASGPNAFDCSGLVQQATKAAGRQLTKPAASQWATCRQQGKTISVANALKIRGALLFRIGAGGTNHVAISLGNGSTMEARGTAYGVNVFDRASHQGWTGGAMWFPPAGRGATGPTAAL